MSQDKKFEPADCSITVSVAQRGQDFWIKCYARHNKDLPTVERQLHKWWEFVRVILFIDFKVEVRENLELRKS